VCSNISLCWCWLPLFHFRNVIPSFHEISIIYASSSDILSKACDKEEKKVRSVLCKWEWNINICDSSDSGIGIIRGWLYTWCGNFGVQKCLAKQFLASQTWLCGVVLVPLWIWHTPVTSHCTCGCRPRLKCDGTHAETRFCLSAKRTSPFKSAGASIQSTTGSRCVRISGSNAGYTVFRGSVKSTGYPLHSPVSSSLPLPCVTVCHHISTVALTCLILATCSTGVSWQLQKWICSVVCSGFCLNSNIVLLSFPVVYNSLRKRLWTSRQTTEWMKWMYEYWKYLLGLWMYVQSFPAHKMHFFPLKNDLNLTCVLCAEGKYYFQTYKYPYSYYTTSLSWDSGEICFQIMRSGITACAWLTFL
jgi:hypothetical protein